MGGKGANQAVQVCVNEPIDLGVKIKDIKLYLKGIQMWIDSPFSYVSNILLLGFHVGFQRCDDLSSGK